MDNILGVIFGGGFIYLIVWGVSSYFNKKANELDDQKNLDKIIAREKAEEKLIRELKIKAIQDLAIQNRKDQLLKEFHDLGHGDAVRVILSENEINKIKEEEKRKFEKEEQLAEEKARKLEMKRQSREMKLYRLRQQYGDEYVDSRLRMGAFDDEGNIITKERQPFAPLNFKVLKK